MDTTLTASSAPTLSTSRSRSLLAGGIATAVDVLDHLRRHDLAAVELAVVADGLAETRERRITRKKVRTSNQR